MQIFLTPVAHISFGATWHPVVTAHSLYWSPTHLRAAVDLPLHMPPGLPNSLSKWGCCSPHSRLVIAVSECKIERSNYLEFEWVTQTQTPVIDLPNEEFLQQKLRQNLSIIRYILRFGTILPCADSINSLMLTSHTLHIYHSTPS